MVIDVQAHFRTADKLSVTTPFHLRMYVCKTILHVAELFNGKDSPSQNTTCVLEKGYESTHTVSQ